jgi:hypothetical protein
MHRATDQSGGYVPQSIDGSLESNLEGILTSSITLVAGSPRRTLLFYSTRCDADADASAPGEKLVDGAQ